MTKIPLYQVDAFTSRLFAGNPAAVCPLEAWLSDELLQAIALENNLSERQLRVIALGRKNFLFVGNDIAGDHLAVLQSLVLPDRSIMQLQNPA